MSPRIRRAAKRFGRPTLKWQRATIPCTGTAPAGAAEYPAQGQDRPELLFRGPAANAYGQTGSQYGQAQASLPDTTPPNQPSTVSVSPADWSSANARTVTWAGVTDMPLNSAALGDNGHVQFVLDPASGTDASTWAWQNTASNAANGSQTFSTAGLEDGRSCSLCARRRHLWQLWRTQRCGTQAG